MLSIESLLLKIQNRKPIVIIAPLVLGLFVGGALVIEPGLRNLNGIKSDLSSLQQKVSSYNFVREGEQKLADKKKLFSGDKAWFTEQINSIAENTGLSILSSLPEEPGKVGEYLDRTSIRIEAESGYHQLGAFVSKLESLDPYVKILSVDISAQSPAGPGQPAPGPLGQGPNPRPARSQSANVYKVVLSIGLFTAASGVL